MLISKKLNDAINAEIGLEFQAHLQYLAMAVYFAARSLDGLAAFFYNQAEEEKVHGLKLVKYVSEAGGEVVIPDIPAPKHDFANAEEVMQLFYDQEKHVTGQFYNMVEMALSERDYTTHNFLQWFIEEQLEEMATSSKLLDLVRMAGEGQLLMIEMMIDKVEAGAAALEPGGEE